MYFSFIFKIFAVDYRIWEQIGAKYTMSYTCLVTNGISISLHILRMLVRSTIFFVSGAALASYFTIVIIVKIIQCKVCYGQG